MQTYPCLDTAKARAPESTAAGLAGRRISDHRSGSVATAANQQASLRSQHGIVDDGPSKMASGCSLGPSGVGTSPEIRLLSDLRSRKLAVRTQVNDSRERLSTSVQCRTGSLIAGRLHVGLATRGPFPIVLRKRSYIQIFTKLICMKFWVFAYQTRRTPADHTIHMSMVIA